MVGRFNPHRRFLNEMFDPLWREAERNGIDPVVIIAQSGHETGWGNFGGVIDETYHNTCGLKTREGGGDFEPEAHSRFPDWTTGARAHAQHLLAYCRVLPPDPIVDPRWDWVYGVKKPISQVAELDAWASHSSYGSRIESVVRRLGVAVEPPKPPKRAKKITTTRKVQIIG